MIKLLFMVTIECGDGCIRAGHEKEWPIVPQIGWMIHVGNLARRVRGIHMGDDDPGGLLIELGALSLQSEKRRDWEATLEGHGWEINRLTDKNRWPTPELSDQRELRERGELPELY